MLVSQFAQRPARAGRFDRWRRRRSGTGRQLPGQLRRVLAGPLNFLNVSAVRVAFGKHAQQQLAEAGDDRKGVVQTMHHLRNRDGAGRRRAGRGRRQNP
jgi:hypothetical protein